MASNKSTPHDWSSLKTFEEAHQRLQHYMDLESTLLQNRGALSPNDHAGHLLIGDQLTVCRTNVLEWKVKVRSANTILKREYRN